MSWTPTSKANYNLKFKFETKRLFLSIRFVALFLSVSFFSFTRIKHCAQMWSHRGHPKWSSWPSRTAPAAKLLDSPYVRCLSKIGLSKIDESIKLLSWCSRDRKNFTFRFSNCFECIASSCLAPLKNDFASAVDWVLNFVDNFGVFECERELLGVESGGDPKLGLIVSEHVCRIKSLIKRRGAADFYHFIF